MTMENEPAIHWPALSDQLFRTSTHWADARVAKDTCERFYRMAEGYKRAGDLLATHAANDVYDRHDVVYPAIFCYRQYLELVLKELIDDYGKHVNVVPKTLDHGLPTLWKHFKQILHCYGHDPHSADVSVVGDHIADFASIDPKSTTFRYAMQKDGSEFEIKIDQLDLINLRYVMETIYTFFDCVGSSLQYSFEQHQNFAR